MICDTRIPRWNDSKPSVCSRIAQTASTAKVVLKTKNETELLSDWIDHHSKIFGYENIIIFDNNSSLQEVKEIYRRFLEHITIVEYDGFVDNVHRMSIFPELYQALAASCRFFIFLDTDERLIWVDQDLTFRADATILNSLANLPSDSVIPGTWLSNVPGYKSRFWLKSDSSSLEAGLRWGKPLVPAHLDLPNLINHNCQIPSSFYRSLVQTNLFVLHLNRLSYQQRINANVNKLQAHGLLGLDNPRDRAINLDPNDYPPGNIRSYITEIRLLVAESELAIRAEKVMRPLDFETIELQDDGRIIFTSSDQERCLRHHLQQPGPVLSRVLGAASDELA